MEAQEKFYVLKRDGEVRRIAKISDGSAYGYEDGNWQPMQHLMKIQWDDTDFEEISKEEANNLIGEK